MCGVVYGTYLVYPAAMGTAFVLMLASIVSAFFNVQVCLILTILLMIVPPLIFQRKYDEKIGTSLVFIFFLYIPAVTVPFVLRSIVAEQDFKHYGGWVYSAKVVEIDHGKSSSITVECLDMEGKTIKEEVGGYYSCEKSSYVLVAKPGNIIGSNILIEKNISEKDYSRFKKGRLVTNGDYNNPQSEADSQEVQKMKDRCRLCQENFIIDHKVIICIILVVIYLLYTLLTRTANIYLFSVPFIYITIVQCYSHCFFYNMELFLPSMAMYLIVIKVAKDV